jgi:hypothetical protein
MQEVMYLKTEYSSKNSMKWIENLNDLKLSLQYRFMAMD